MKIKREFKKGFYLKIDKQEAKTQIIKFKKKIMKEKFQILQILNLRIQIFYLTKKY